MTSRDEALTDPVVDALLARLGEAARSQDPVPAAVLANAAAALELRDLDTALAALVADSDDVDEALALVRGPQSTRLLTFEAPAVDLPRHEGFAAGRRCFTVDHAAPGKDFRRPCLDIRALDRDTARAETRGHETGQYRRHECSFHKRLSKLARV